MTTQEALDINRSSVFALRQELTDKDWARFAGDNATWMMGFDDDTEMPSANTAGLLYVLTDGIGHYKIGQTTNLSQRIRSLSTGMPMDLTVAISYQTAHGRNEEKRWHKTFASKRIKGEWYALTEEDINIIRSNADSPENQTDNATETANKVSPEIQTNELETSGVSESPENQTVLESRKLDSGSPENQTLGVQKIVSGSPEIQTAYKEEPAKEPAKRTARQKTVVPSAIAFVRQLTHRYPDKTLWDRITQTLGEDFDQARMTLCYENWVSHGWNKMNLAWLFDWYVKGMPQNQTGRAGNAANVPDAAYPPVVSAPPNYRQSKLRDKGDKCET